MSCIFSFKFIFAVIGWRIGRGWGLFFGFMLGSYIDSMFHQSTIHFTFQHGSADDFSGYHKQEQKWQPYVDVTLQEAYRTLGIPETATDEEVRQAYRKLAIKYHPDRFQSKSETEKAEAKKKFCEVTEARDIIFRNRGI